MGQHEKASKSRLNIILVSWGFLKKHVFAAISALVLFVGGILAIISFFKPFYPLSDIDFDLLKLSYRQLKNEDFSNYVYVPYDFSIEESIKSGNYCYTQLSLTNKNDFDVSISKVVFEANNIQKLNRPYLTIICAANEPYGYWNQKETDTPNEAFICVRNDGTQEAEDVCVYIDTSEINLYLKEKLNYVDHPIFIDSVKIGEEIKIPIFYETDFVKYPDTQISFNEVYATCTNSSVTFKEFDSMFCVGPYGFGQQQIGGKGDCAFAIMIDANRSMQKIECDTMDIIEGNERFWFPICIASTDTCTFEFTISLEINGNKNISATTKKITFEYPKEVNAGVNPIDALNPEFDYNTDPFRFDLATYPFDSETRYDYRQHSPIDTAMDCFELPATS